MSNSLIPVPQPLNLRDGNVSENWRRFYQKWSNYEIAAGVEPKSNKVRVAALLSIIGDEAVDLYETFEWDQDADKWKLDEVVKKFKGYCQPRANVLFETYRFSVRKQEENENIDSYVTALRQLAEPCEFTDKDRRIRDQVVLGLRDNRVRERILREANPDLTKLLEMVRATEIAEEQARKMNGGREENQINKIQKFEKRPRGQEKPKSSHGPKTTKQPRTGVQCKFCARVHELVKEKCPAFGKICNSCGKANHFENCCRQKSQKPVSVVTETLEQISLYKVEAKNSKKKTKSVTVTKTGLPIKFHIDTGASCNVLSLRDYVKVSKDYKKINLQPNNVELITYGGQKWRSVGTANLEIEVDKKRHVLSCVIVDINHAQPLLSLESSEKLGVVKVLSCDQETVAACSVEKGVSKDDILTQYADVFKGLGRLEGNYKITLDEDVNPVIHPPRKVPVALRETVREKLIQLERDQVIEKVTKPTEWVSSMLIVNKPGKLRICLDPRDLNRAIKREHYPLPTIEDVATRLKTAKVFTVLDARKGFWQVELDEASSYLTTFNTPFGRYRWKRMPFGVNSAPEVWQRRMHEFVEGLNGVEVIADDFLVCGYGPTMGEALRDHDANLLKLLDKARQQNLKLNPEKMKLRMTEVSFIGHVLTGDGLKMDPKKIEAINKMPSPTCAKDLLRILGMVQYLAKFLPRLSDLTEPLRHLTRKEADWVWTDKEEKVMKKVKELITRDPVLRYFDSKLPVEIQCDASDKGLGAVLLQKGQPVAFSSRTMTFTEQRYAQIEKEMLAIVHACTKFHDYIYGLPNVEVETDHKPLETIFKKEISKSPKRLQRMLLSVQKFNLNVKYKRGAELFIADTLSRAYLTDSVPEKFSEVLCVREQKLIEEFACASTTAEIENPKTRTEQIRVATAKDSTLLLVMDYIQKGWPTDQSDVENSVMPYFQFRDELIVEDGLVLKSDRVVIPAALRKSVMETIHSTHIGIENCLRRAREYVYWPMMNSEMKSYMSKCDICNKFRAEQTKEPMLSHEIPNRPWEIVSSDLFELNGHNFIVVVDHYSSFFEYEKLQQTNTTYVVRSLKLLFARYGVPKKLISDNGPQYSGSEFKKFAETWGFQHVTSSPRYPQSNGKAESAVKICKGLMKKAIAGNVDFQMCLLDWRNTPSATIGSSPAQRFFSRRTRSLLPIEESLMDPHVPSCVPQKIVKAKEDQAKYYNRNVKTLPELASGQAVRMKLPGETVWTKGVCLKALGDRSYHVKVKGAVYRRNRRQLYATNEDPPTEEKNRPNDDLDESSIPEMRRRENQRNRPRRIRRPPYWLNDYVR